MLWDQRPVSRTLMFKSHNHISQICLELSYCSKDTLLCFYLSSKSPSSRVKHCQDDLRWRKTEAECLHSDSEESKLLVATGNGIFSFQGTAYIFCCTNIRWEQGKERLTQCLLDRKGKKSWYIGTYATKDHSHTVRAQNFFTFFLFPDLPP